MANKKILIPALVALVVILGGAFYTTNLGVGSVRINPDEYPNGIIFGQNSKRVNYADLSLDAGENQAHWYNTTGKQVMVDLSAFTVDGTASSSMTLYVGTSTTATVSDSSTIYGSLIDGYVIATSSTNRIVISNFENGGTAGQSVIPVNNGEYLVLQMEATYSGLKCTGAKCETATSTNRGFNLDGVIRYFW